MQVHRIDYLMNVPIPVLNGEPRSIDSPAHVFIGLNEDNEPLAQEEWDTYWFGYISHLQNLSRDAQQEVERVFQKPQDSTQSYEEWIAETISPIGTWMLKQQQHPSSWANGLEENMGLTNLSVWMSRDIRSFCMSGFGFYRKDLAKLVLSSSPVLVDWMMSISSFLSQDAVVRAFRENLEHEEERNGIMLIDSQTIQRLLSVFTHPTTRYNIAAKRKTSALLDSRSFSDLLDLSSIQTCDEKFSGVQDVYDYLGKQESGAHLNEIAPCFKKVEFPPLENYEMTRMSSWNDYSFTASHLRLCLSRLSYLLQAQDDEKMHFMLRDEKQNLVGALELTRDMRSQPFTFSELKGYDNSLLPDVSENAIQEWVTEANRLMKEA